MKNEFNEVRKQLIMLNVWRLPIDTTNANHLTPLHLAVIHNCDENIVSFLLDKGADIGCTDSEGNNSMHLAVFHNSQTLLHLLLQKAIDTNFNFNNTFNYEGFTPLLLATIEDKLDMVKTFLEFGADPNIRDQKSGRTPLFHAVENNNMIMVQLLLHHRADKKIKNFSGTSTHDAVFELEGISADIKNMIIGKEIFTVNSTRTDKRKKPTVDKTKEMCTKRLRTVKTYRKINM
ncbi:Ankyrin repeat-containing protein [Oryctes borbonicus]|uniref:Ankyrin repeat-containing protein n=1 Tax=Oryctes borbonicus TaxID=1629725 RepID=A0A0T6BD73_9SCAR|nr:Ankyrin repeat-containing protein [Oryctes borbonicus]